MPLISNKNYAILGAIPVVQTVLGAGVVLKNLGLLVKDAWLSVFGPGSDKIDQEVKDLLEAEGDKGYFLQEGNLCWMGNIENAGKDHKKKYLELAGKIHNLTSTKACPQQHFSGICTGIITAIPVIGTVVNYNTYKRIEKLEEYRRNSDI